MPCGARIASVGNVAIQCNIDFTGSILTYTYTSYTFQICIRNARTRIIIRYIYIFIVTDVR